MHPMNKEYLKHCSEKYHKYFHDVENVLEIGSMNINGTMRQYFKNVHNYVGVDWREGRDVDLVCFAHDMKFDYKFDTVISASTLEHDKFWDKTLRKVVDYMKDDGILIFCWGGALCQPHSAESAVDGGFHSLPAENVINLLTDLGLYIHEFQYEGNLPFKARLRPPGGMGEVCLVAFKDKKYLGKPMIDELLPEDKICIKN